MSVKPEVEKFVKDFLKAWGNFNAKEMDKMVYSDQNSVHIGTDDDEYILGKKALLKRIQAIGQTKVTMGLKVNKKNIVVSPCNKAANFSLDIDTQVYKNQKLIKKFSGLRISGFLVKQEKIWKLAGSHISIPVKVKAINY